MIIISAITGITMGITKGTPKNMNKLDNEWRRQNLHPLTTIQKLGFTQSDVVAHIRVSNENITNVVTIKSEEYKFKWESVEWTTLFN